MNKSFSVHFSVPFLIIFLSNFNFKMTFLIYYFIRSNKHIFPPIDFSFIGCKSRLKSSDISFLVTLYCLSSHISLVLGAFCDLYNRKTGLSAPIPRLTTKVLVVRLRDFRFYPLRILAIKKIFISRLR